LGLSITFHASPTEHELKSFIPTQSARGCVIPTEVMGATFLRGSIAYYRRTGIAIKVLHHSGDVADTLTIGVGKALWIDLIDQRVSPGRTGCECLYFLHKATLLAADEERIQSTSNQPL
jgi:hypothetical protein